MKIKTINPATEEVLAEYEMMTKEQVNNTVRFYDQLVHHHHVE